jgi:hypothetical protein
MTCSRVLFTFTFTFGQHSVQMSPTRAVFREVSFVKISLGEDVLYLWV